MIHSTHWCRLIFAAVLLIPSLPLLAVEAPEPFVTDDNRVIWLPVDATTINVHRANGDWVESLPGSTTSWSPQMVGDYFFVGADNGDWRNWERSETITINSLDFSIEPPEALRIDSVRVEIYSPTSAEIFWTVPPNSPAREYGIIAIPSDPDVLFPGDGFTANQNWLFENLLPGAEYSVSIDPIDNTGNFGELGNIIFTMPGELTTEQIISQQPVPDTERPDIPPPADFRVEVYSETAAELFWTHTSAINEFPIDYAITLNDTLIARTTGSSLFLSDLEPNREHTAYIFASRASGGDSVLQSVTFSTGGTQPILVPEDNNPASNSTPLDGSLNITVNDFRISWPDDGWYEVQNVSDYSPVCMGGRSCVVQPGIYNIINHTTGERVNGFVVNETQGASPDTNPERPLVLAPRKQYIATDGSYGTRSSDWEVNTQWADTEGNSLTINNQIIGQSILASGAQCAVNHSGSHLQLLIIGHDSFLSSAEIFWDANNSSGISFDGQDDFHIIIPVSNTNREAWQNNRSRDSDSVLEFGPASASIDPSAIEFATCTCGGVDPLWEVNIDLAAAKIPLNTEFGFDVRLNWQFQAADGLPQRFSFGWADTGSNTQPAPSNMGKMILID